MKKFNKGQDSGNFLTYFFIHYSNRILGTKVLKSKDPWLFFFLKSKKIFNKLKIDFVSENHVSKYFALVF